MPRISVVTPSFNQAAFLEETIRSVLLQSYPELQYIVIDGGSSDGSVEIIERYGAWLDHWESEPDRGQTHAINKGFARTDGELVAWLNSDDLYLPGALERVASTASTAPGALVAGHVLNFADDGAGERLIEHREITLERVIAFWEGRVWHQPGLFFPRRALDAAGPLDEGLRYAMDYDLLCRLLQHAEVAYTGTALARFRIHHRSKTTTQAGVGFILENSRVARRYWQLLGEPRRRDCERGAVRALVRRAGRQLARGRPGLARRLLAQAWSINRSECAAAVVAEALSFEWLRRLDELREGPR